MRGVQGPSVTGYNTGNMYTDGGLKKHKMHLPEVKRDEDAMRFEFTPQLIEYMQKKGRRHLAVEVATADHSDFDVAELYYRLIDDKTVEFLKKKRYRTAESEIGYVMLPPYHLEYDETVTFRLKKVLFFTSVTTDGIRL